MQAFAGFSSNHTLSAQVNFFAALAPVAYVDHAQGLLPLLADLDLDFIFQLFGLREFGPDASWLQKLAPELCADLGWACADVLFWIAGKTNHLNETRIPVLDYSSIFTYQIQVYTSETPAGTSVKNMAHWAQAVRGEDFQMYDYGCNIISCPNRIHYGQDTPPKYNLTKFNVPTAFYYGRLTLLTLSLTI
jgi:lysosomal acid lipase/cholesteryl ester hydrolase